MTDQLHASLSFLIHADSKVGKSTLACTAPPPLVIFDAEGSTKFLPLRMTQWNPTQGPPPVYDGTWDACLVVVNRYEDLQLGYDWLNAGQHTFRSVVLDSITEIQRKLKTNIRGYGKLEWDDWDELLRRMDVLIRNFRDLTQHQTNPMTMAVFVAETKMRDGRYWPSMQGQIINNLPYWVDVVGYLGVSNDKSADGVSPRVNEHGEPYEFRWLLTRATNPLYYAGQRVQGRIPATVTGVATDVPPASMGDVTPNLTSMLLQVYPHLAEVRAS